MAGQLLECWNCYEELRLKPGRELANDATCPHCGEYLQDDCWELSESGTRGSTRLSSNHTTNSWILPLIIGGACCGLMAVGIAIVLIIGDLQKPEPVAVSEPVAPVLEPVGSTGNGIVDGPRDEIPDAPNGPAQNKSVDSIEAKTPEIVAASTVPSDLSDATIEEIGRRKRNQSGKDAAFAFVDGDEYRFRYTVTAELEDRTEETTGSVTYTVQGRDKQEPVTGAITQEGSGTAFVVAADGILVTCAHVVEDANDIEVHIAGKQYTAKVLEIDSAIDLAVIKIEATELPTLPLADSDQAQLGQDVRAIGFPLSDVLGTEVKVTRGTISGILNRGGERQLQIDAAVNPGNSGGPVVNSNGEVVGVASAKLSRVDVSRVGFCVPSNPVREIVRKAGTELPASAATRELSGTELVSLATPAVAFVKVKTGPGANSKYTELRFSGSFHKTVKDGRGIVIPTFNIGGMGHGNGTMLLTHVGEIVRTSEEEQLPFLLGPPSQLPIFELPRGNRKTWTQKSETSLIQEKQQTTPSGIPLPRFRDPFGRSRNTEVVKVLPAVEITTYTIESENANQLVVSIEHDFHTVVADDGQVIKMLGKGTVTFDKSIGFTKTYVFKGNYMIESEQVTLKVPLEVTASLMSKAEIDDQNKRIAEAKKAADDKPVAVNSMGTAPKLDVGVKQQIPEMGWGIKSLAFSPDAKFVAAGKSDEFLEVYDVETGRKIFTEGRMRDMGNISALAFSPDGKHLLAGGYKGIVRIWEMAENGLLTPVGDFVGHSREVSAIVISPDGKRVMSGSSERRVRCWELATQKEEFALAEFDSNKFGVHFVNENEVLVSDGKRLQRVDLGTGKAEQTFELRESGSAQAVFFSPDASVVTVADGYSLKRWSTTDGKELPELKDKEMLWTAEYTPDSEQIVVGGRGHLLIWNAARQEREGQILLGDSIQYVNPLDVSNDGRYVACYPSSAGQSLWIFDLTTLPTGLDEESK